MDYEFNQLVALAYGSLSGPDGHAAFLRGLATAFRSHLIASQVDTPGHEHTPLAHYDSQGRQMDDLALAASKHPYVNPWFESPMVARLLQHGVADDQGCVEPASLRRTEFYADILSPFDIFHSFGFVLKHAVDSTSVTSVSRSSRVGPYSQSELELAKALLPHLRNIHSVQTALVDSGLSGIDGQRRAVWVLGNGGQVCGRNRCARENALVATVLMERNGRLLPLYALDRPLLTASIERVLSGSYHSRVPLRDRFGTPRYIAHVHSLCGQAFQTWLLSSKPAAMVIMRSLQCDALQLAPTLKELYGLTTAESRVAVKLLELESVHLVAESVCRSEETVRSQLKAIFAKTGANSQVRLLRILYALAQE